MQNSHWSQYGIENHLQIVEGIPFATAAGTSMSNSLCIAIAAQNMVINELRQQNNCEIKNVGNTKRKVVFLILECEKSLDYTYLFQMD